MNWLAEEAARRYYNSCGLRPQLVLCTQEGAMFAPEDSVTDLLTNNEEVSFDLSLFKFKCAKIHEILISSDRMF